MHDSEHCRRDAGSLRVWPEPLIAEVVFGTSRIIILTPIGSTLQRRTHSVRRSRRSGTLRATAGVYYVASRLSYEGFRTTVAQRPGTTGTDVLAGLSGAPGTAALMVRTSVCPPGFGDGEGTCEWRVGRGGALTNHPGTFVALVDLGRGEELPGVWVLPSARVRGHFASLEELKPYRYRASAEELAPYEDGWDAVEDHLVGERPSRMGWFLREEIEERYGEGFVKALDAEASRLLRAQNSTIRKMADERFSAEELADASALLRVLFGRWMEAERQRKRDGGA